MPKMDGREALTIIKNDAVLRSIPVVVLTTSAEEDDVFYAYRLGVSSYISKPVTFEGLVNVVKVLNAYWLEARDIEDRTVLREIGANVGLDADALVDAIDDPNYIEQVDADINLARTYGLQGVPALIFEQKYLIPGAVPVATLRQAVEQVQQERAQ